MILDDIIAAIVGLFQFLIESTVIVVEPVVNSTATGLEALIALFVTDFQLGRMRKRKKRSKMEIALRLLPSLLILAAIAWFFVTPKVMNRTVTFIAEDGHSLTYAGVIVHGKDGDRHRRTNRQGELRIKRFSTRALTLQDARYVERTWERSEIEATLTASRSVLGSGLDRLGDRLRRALD